jgi:hypothetical protein
MGRGSLECLAHSVFCALIPIRKELVPLKFEIA